MNDQAAGDIGFPDLCLSGPGIFSWRFEKFPKLFWIRPRDRAPLSPQRVNDEIRTIGTEAGFRSGIDPVVQFATPEEVGQAELLGDCGAEPIARETSDLDHRCFANVAADLDPRLQPDGSDILSNRERLRGSMPPGLS